VLICSTKVPGDGLLVYVTVRPGSLIVAFSFRFVVVHVFARPSPAVVIVAGVLLPPIVTVVAVPLLR